MLRPIAVVDIGSNTMRLVIYDGLKRVPLPTYNTKVTARLGHGLGETGRLHPGGIELALHGLARFARIIDGLECQRVIALATAATRIAEDGQAFIGAAEERLGHPIRVIEGAEEARLSAMGVISALPDADGVVADLGGGSLELAAVRDGKLGARISLPIGALTLMDLAEGGSDQRETRRLIQDHLEGIDWLPDLADRRLYLVGGAWRALAKLHMDASLYPLPLIQGYSLPAAVARDVARRLSPALGEPEKLAGISARRSETVPPAALVLRRLIANVKPNTVVFSAFGLREGALFDALPESVRAVDPLQAGAAREAPEDDVRQDHTELLMTWTAPLFVEETQAQARLRRAACRLIDIAWFEHPAIRAELAARRVLWAHGINAPHDERAYLAAVLLHRYGGSRKTPGAADVMALLPEPLDAPARILGAALRLAGKISARSPALLEQTGLRVEDGKLDLLVPDEGPLDEGVAARLETLAKASGLELGPLSVDPG
ncbi:Ppx/GppA phosphatase family protein [Marinivivus vitaminiproducens]|uniref:Ppx/GppA phosphatase family protein n=1 Tax=Marinivivus vitaminiproducens TaxID=3035935 RepID=UPI002799ADA4|nr:Ppx/GppA family phosphatase [Geminicoccaceae bacterium SCSIO 64248]